MTVSRYMVLTPIRRKVLAQVAAQPDGYPLTVREICARVGLVNLSTTAHHLKVLRENGYLADTAPGSPRTIALAEDVAVSRNGLVARVVPVEHCEPCGLTLPADHHCEADLKTSLEWTTHTPKANP